MTIQYYADGVWSGARTIELPIGAHGLWNSAAVFDGARSIRRMAPDLLTHCRRLVEAAPSMLLQSPLSAEQLFDICVEGILRFPEDAELYLTPMLFSTSEDLIPAAGTTQFMLSVRESPLRRDGFSVCSGTSVIRPAPGTMQTNYKTSWLYANAIPARKQALDRGFDEALMQDPAGNVVEFSTSNLWLVRNGQLVTPIENGSFLPGITRRRILSLLEHHGIVVEQRLVSMDDIRAADELFSTGNSSKVRPVTRMDDRILEAGPVLERVRAIYWDYAATQRVGPSA